MKIDKINPQLVLYIAAGAALLYVTYKSTKAVGSAIDSVTSIPGKIGDGLAGAWHAIGDTASSAWNTVEDVFTGAPTGVSMPAPYARNQQPTGMTFNEGAAPGADITGLLDMRYYGDQGNTVLEARTSSSGPGSGSIQLGSTQNSAVFFNGKDALAGM